MGGWAQIFELFTGKNIDSDKMNLGVTVLAGLGGTHFNNFAGALLDDHETVLTKGRALLRVGSRGASVGALEGVLML